MKMGCVSTVPDRSRVARPSVIGKPVNILFQRIDSVCTGRIGGKLTSDRT